MPKYYKNAQLDEHGQLPIRPLSPTTFRKTGWTMCDESTTVERIRWRRGPNNRKGLGNLDVVYRSGAGYRYYEIDEATWTAFRDSPSKGRYLNAFILPHAVGKTRRWR